jgi:serine/threonine-protein kinase
VPSHRDDDVTLAPSVAATRVATTPGSAAGRAPGSSRFTPGEIVAGRYRLVALLGRGGMGEVYRADDLTLDQPVALKFLPGDGGGGGDPAQIAQFHNELRTARQVSHKNVCRLYDLGEADGRRFLTMEYVDGEDVASLVRRIGRLPQDKAIDIARQICAGLAAAHERGVLHRDLKPANVMLDGDGNVRLTDFGLASAIGDATAVRAGTPQYMAPEQLAGQTASIKSDIYALGLVLFEIFTGKRAYDAKTLHDLMQLHESGMVTTPSSVVHDLDPAVERIILRCLERDPARRPGSALAVAAALPGGNPLADALAAGETPSPELLVAAGEAEAMPVVPALSAVAVFVAALIALAAIAPRASIPGLVPLDKPTDVLTDRAEQMIASFGYADPAIDRARGFTIPPDAPRWLQSRGPADWWPSLRSGTPPALLFWYRTSPRDLVPDSPAATVSSTDPPPLVSGMQLVILDTKGRLVEYHSVPPQLDTHATPAAAPNWRVLFDAAGLDMATFTPATPEWTPPNFADTRAAWDGPSPDRSDLAVRIEAAAYRGRPASFYMIGPWARPTRMQPLARSTGQTVMTAINVAVSLAALIGAALLARYNLRANRADRKGAARLAIGLVIMTTIAWMFATHHVAAPDLELRELLRATGFATFLGITVWVFYLAIEPYVRRFWPDGLLGWTRLLSGRLRDPRVGRDVLIGLVFGAGLMALETAQGLLPQRWGYTAPLPPFGNAVPALASAAYVVSRSVNMLYNSLQTVLLVTMIFVVLRLVLRRGWLAALTGVVILMGLSDNGQAFTGTWFDFATIGLIFILVTFGLFRFGLLAMTVAAFSDNVATGVPLTLHLSAWWATPSLLTLALLIGLAAFGFYAARAGQPLFGNLELGT